MSEPSNNTTNDTQKDKMGANQRGSARLAAVQALYQMDVAKTPLDDVLAEFESYRLGMEVDGMEYRPADASYFTLIVKGVFNHQAILDAAIEKATQGKWNLKKLDVTVRAILRAGTFELIYRDEVPPMVALREYIDIADAFFENEEVRFLNGVLNNISKNRESYRTDIF